MNDHQHTHSDHGHVLPLRPHFILLTFLLAVTSFGLCFAAGYGLSQQIFKITGEPEGVWSRIAAGLLGLLVFIVIVAIARLFTELYYKKHPEKQRPNRSWENSRILTSTVDAMNRISRGDFNVLIPTEIHDPFSEVAESVNKMAHELSSMENLRQDFISNVSHEIQSPLTSIGGFAALLRDDSLPEDVRMHYLDIIESESKRLSKLSDNLLKLSSLETDATRIAACGYRLDKQIENAVLMLEPQWSAKKLVPDISLLKTNFSGDEELLSQVWINLLHNAIKFTPEGGSFGIVLTASENEVSCSVSDSGIGIPKEDQMHVFERFYKVDKSRDRAQGGNGLGLSLVKKIVDLHDGQIDLESEEGIGTTFIVHLPISQN